MFKMNRARWILAAVTMIVIVVGGLIWLLSNERYLRHPITIHAKFLDRETLQPVPDCRLVFRTQGRRGFYPFPHTAGPMSEGILSSVDGNASGELRFSFRDDHLILEKIYRDGVLVDDYTAYFHHFDGIDFVTECYLNERGGALYPEASDPYLREYTIVLSTTPRSKPQKGLGYSQPREESRLSPDKAP
jgi:hypothetical protein